MVVGGGRRPVGATPAGPPPRLGTALLGLPGADRLRAVTYVDRPRRRLFGLRQPHRQDAVLVIGGDGSAADPPGESERAHEPALPALAPVAPARAGRRGPLDGDDELSV